MGWSCRGGGDVFPSLRCGDAEGRAFVREEAWRSAARRTQCAAVVAACRPTMRSDEVGRGLT